MPFGRRVKKLMIDLPMGLEPNTYLHFQRQYILIIDRHCRRRMYSSRTQITRDDRLTPTAFKRIKVLPSSSSLCSCEIG